MSILHEVLKIKRESRLPVEFFNFELFSHLNYQSFCPNTIPAKLQQIPRGNIYTILILWHVIDLRSIEISFLLNVRNKFVTYTSSRD